jgi:lipoprotein-anchoring transpeptidase ErfK/SrfK
LSFKRTLLWAFLGLALCAGASAAPQSDLKLPTTTYEVQKGDNLTVIAKKHGVTVGQIIQSSGLSSDRISIGQKLTIPAYKLSIFIDKSDNTLTLKGDAELIKTYTVSTGTGNSTPVGTFKITDKLENPTWYKAGAVKKPGDPENQLGTRWMGWDLKGYGIHGTTEPEKLGQQASAGCIRMKNEEVEELYRLVPPGTPVTVVD